MSYISDVCPAGTFQSANKAFCLRCKEDTIGTKGLSSCTLCEAGIMANKNRMECGNLILCKLYFPRVIISISHKSLILLV